MGEVTRAIVEFVASASFDDLPVSVQDRAKIHMVDSLGLALAGAGSPSFRILCGHLAHQGLAKREATVFGTRMRMPSRFAAPANGTAIHSDNFDDTSPQVQPRRTGGIHASAAVLPVALALGELHRTCGKQILIAYCAGIEVASRLNHAMAQRHYTDGFHATGTLGVFGAVAAAGVMLRLDAETMRNAIGVAASLGSGVRRNFGTMAETMHPGHAAESGIVAADLAERGLTAASDALDGAAGYLLAAGGGFDPSEIVGRLGAPWVFDSPGVWIKPHPNGSLTHPAVGCLLDMLKTSQASSQDIGRIRVRTNRRILNTLLHDAPENIGQARFSMPFALAAAAVRRRLGLAEFTAENLESVEVREMMARVEHTAFDREEDGFTNVTSFVEIVLKNGRRLGGRADHARGSSASPFGFEDVVAKFAECAFHGGHPPVKSAGIPELIGKLDQLDRLEQLWSALAR